MVFTRISMGDFHKRTVSFREGNDPCYSGCIFSRLHFLPQERIPARRRVTSGGVWKGEKKCSFSRDALQNPPKQCVSAVEICIYTSIFYSNLWYLGILNISWIAPEAFDLGIWGVICKIMPWKSWNSPRVSKEESHTVQDIPRVVVSKWAPFFKSS